MPAVSKKQQRFFGMVRAFQKGDSTQAPSSEVARVASSIKMKDAKKFASTKHKGLPEKKVKKESVEHVGNSDFRSSAEFMNTFAKLKRLRKKNDKSEMATGLPNGTPMKNRRGTMQGVEEGKKPMVKVKLNPKKKIGVKVTDIGPGGKEYVRKDTMGEGSSYGLYKGSGKPSGAMKKYLDKRAKMLQKKRDSQSDAAKNNPHFDSTVPSPSGRNKYEQVSFKDFINESSLSRIKSKSDKGGIAIMSASRGDKSKKENSARGKQLDKDIRGRFGRGATKVTGSYMEKGDDGKERKVKEKSHVIDRGKMGKRKFKKAVKKLGKKYGQDSVLTQTKKSATLSATRKGGLGKAKGVNVGKFKPQGKNPEGQSQIKGKTFTYG